MKDSTGRQYSASFVDPPHLGDGNNINPGLQVSVKEAFDVPPDVRPTQIVLHDSASSHGVPVNLAHPSVPAPAPQRRKAFFCDRYIRRLQRRRPPHPHKTRIPHAGLAPVRRTPANFTACGYDPVVIDVRPHIAAAISETHTRRAPRELAGKAGELHSAGSVTLPVAAGLNRPRR